MGEIDIVDRDGEKIMSEKEILKVVRERLGIEALNELQREVLMAWKSSNGGDLVVY